ncbi:MAG: hypothetical protein ACRCXZ_10795 [Patescibacteria group bacterium]
MRKGLFDTFKTDVVNIIIFIILLFLSLILVSNLINNFSYNKKINSAIQKITFIRSNLGSFKLHYSSGFLPASEVKGMNNLLTEYSSDIKNLISYSEVLNIKEKIQIQSLSLLYEQKVDTLLKISNQFYQLNNLNQENFTVENKIEKLIENERLKSSFADSASVSDFYKKRIDHLRDIKYNINDPIFRVEAERKLVTFLRYFSTNHIVTFTSLDKNIESKEKELLN